MNDLELPKRRVISNKLFDQREDHKTDPPTLWFIADTDMSKKLKIVFIQKDGDIILKTAYLANEAEISIYEKFAY